MLALPALASASTFTVNTLGDEYSPSGCVASEPCSLRTAIVKANQNEGTDTIEFSVAGTIHLEPETLPGITDPVIIDATTLPAYDGVPLVEIDGSNAQTEGATEGISMFAGSEGSRIEGLAIGGFETGVRLVGSSQLCASYVGVELDGTTALPNFNGVETIGEGAEVGGNCFTNGGNLISGNNAYGVVDFGEFTTIVRNRIGVDATGAPLPNGPEGGVAAGILVSSVATETTIGGLPGEGGELGNAIAFNSGYGILIEDGASNVEMRANSIHGNTIAAIEILTGPEMAQPELSFNSLGAGASTVAGVLHAEPTSEYEIDVFASPSCYASTEGEATKYIGTIFVTTDDGGEVEFVEEALESPPAGYEYVTATATSDATRETSLVSHCWDQPPGVAVGTVPNGISSSAEGTFEFIGIDANGSVAGFECRLDGGAFETCTSPQTYTDLDDGSHHFELRAIDQVGTVQAEPFSYSWTVDTTYPSETIEAAPANPTNQTGAEFQFSTGDGAEGSGVRKVECEIDGGQLGPCTSPRTYAGLSEGTHEFQLWATDWAGHTSVETYVWTIDTEAPTAAIEAQPPSSSGSAAASFDFSGDDGDGSGVARFECSLDGGQFTTCTSPRELTGLAEGPHSFEVRSVDAAGNTSAPASYSWTVDTTQPTITLESTPSDPTSQAFATIEFSASDPGGSGIASTKCRFDGTVLTTCTSPDSISPLADGRHVFEVRATDNAGNAKSETFEWTVDTTAPQTTIESQPANPSSSASPSFGFSGDDGDGSGVASFDCSLDGGEFAPCTSPQEYTGLGDGPHSFEVKAADAAGNTDASPAVYSWTIETAVPAAPQLSGTAPASPAADTMPLVEGSAPAGTAVSLFANGNCSGEPVVPTATPAQLAAGIEVTVAANAVTEFSATSTSPALVRSACSTPISYREDSTAPTTTIQTEPPPASGSTAATFTFSGDDGAGSGVARFECSLDGATFATCASPQGYTGLADGPHSFEVRAVDNAGNADASPAASAWVVDTSGPEATIETRPASLADNGDPSFTFAGDDTTAGFECSLDGSPFEACASPQVYDGLDDGPHVFEVQALDAVGNAGPPAAYGWTVDSTAPTTAIESQPASSSGSGAASFEFSGGDESGSGVSGFECSLDSAPFAPCASPQEYSGLSEGPHTFEVRAVDAAGNTAMPVAYSWTVEPGKPSSQPPGDSAPQELLAPAPSNGESVAVAPEGGKVFVQRPGQKKPTELKEGETIPVGSLVDATNGKVLLTSVNANGEAQSAYFFGGKFLVTQHEGSGLVVLKLRGSLSCSAAARSSSVFATASGKSGRQLWGSGHGNFRTEGSSGSATVRGTIWLTEDRCDGSTFFRVRRGIVSVRDFTLNKTIPVTAGHTYTAGP
ncbi:MAG TPA: hypothetical protein VGI73_15340 [Solirubrobacterales bacterium]|jgi:hypothetical protein